MARRSGEMSTSPELGEDIFHRMEQASGKELDGVIIATLAAEGEQIAVWGMTKLDGKIRGVLPDAASELLVEIADSIRHAT